MPSVGGFYIPDVLKLELSPWERKGGSGVFLNLEGTGDVNDAHVVEIRPPENWVAKEMESPAGEAAHVRISTRNARSVKAGLGIG